MERQAILHLINVSRGAMTYPNPTPASINLYIRRRQGRDVATNTKGKGLTVIIPALNNKGDV
jgi:hypothetical protein